MRVPPGESAQRQPVCAHRQRARDPPGGGVHAQPQHARLQEDGGEGAMVILLLLGFIPNTFYPLKPDKLNVLREYESMEYTTTPPLQN